MQTLIETAAEYGRTIDIENNLILTSWSRPPRQAGAQRLVKSASGF